jgi:hypothetical protein
MLEQADVGRSHVDRQDPHRDAALGERRQLGREWLRRRPHDMALDLGQSGPVGDDPLELGRRRAANLDPAGAAVKIVLLVIEHGADPEERREALLVEIAGGVEAAARAGEIATAKLRAAQQDQARRSLQALALRARFRRVGILELEHTGRPDAAKQPAGRRAAGS